MVKKWEWLLLMQLSNGLSIKNHRLFQERSGVNWFSFGYASTRGGQAGQGKCEGKFFAFTPTFYFQSFGLVAGFGGY
jgi:hypothetical protein